MVSDLEEERGRATEILTRAVGPQERGVENRGLTMAPDPQLNPERVRQGQETARLELSRVLTVERFRSLTEVPTPIPVSQMAVLGRAAGEAAELSKHLLPFLSPGADIILGFIEDIYTAITGERIVYSQLESVEATTLDRAMAVVNVALALIPTAGRLLRQGGKIAQIARVLNRFAGRREALERAMVQLRLGQRPTAQQGRALREFLEELRSVEPHYVRRVADARGTTARATYRGIQPPREIGAGGITRSARRGRQAQRRGRRGSDGSSRRGRRGSSAQRGLARLNPKAQDWLRTILRNDSARITRASQSLNRARAEVIHAINVFHPAGGFDSVVTGWLAGGNNRLGAEFVMRFALDKFGQRVSPLLVFEMRTMRLGPQSRAIRRIDIFAPDGIRYELKWGNLRKHLRSRVKRELVNDLIAQQGTQLKFRWVFSSETAGLSREEIVVALQRWIAEDSFLRGHPRIGDVLRAIDEMVVVWP